MHPPGAFAPVGRDCAEGRANIPATRTNAKAAHLTLFRATILTYECASSFAAIIEWASPQYSAHRTIDSSVIESTMVSHRVVV